MIETWDNQVGAAPRVNAGRPLTRSLDLGEEGLAMQATRICSVTECDRPHNSRGLCNMHYQRLVNSGTTDARERPVGCSIAGCEAEHFGHGWCQKHYARWRIHGDVSDPAPREKSLCAVEECERQVRSRGWCDMHYSRWARTGDPLGVRVASTTLPGPTHPSWQGDNIGYQRAHRRVDHVKGLPSSHPCVDCGEPAAEWSYDHLDPDEKMGDRWHPHAYSVKPEHYQARCVRCHRNFDKAPRS